MFTVKKDSEGQYVELTGSIVAGQVAQLRELLYDLASKQKRLVLDFEKVTHIDSTSIGLLISTQIRIRKVGGHLQLLHVKPVILEVLKTMRLDRVFEMITDHDEMF